MPEPSYSPDDTLRLSNLGKVFWPECGLTKGDLIAYYREIAPVIVPYLADRPQVLHRHVDGHTGKEFFQRTSRQRPKWLPVVNVKLDGKERDFHLIQDWPALLWTANFGSIEIIPWNSRVGSLDRPDYLIIDLDPEAVPFARVVEVAVAVRKVFDKAGAASFCKTSGKRGLHVYVPMGRRYEHGPVRMLGELVARLVERQLPDLTSRDPRTDRRQGRVYLDNTRNARGQSMVAPYSARPHPGATVSAPLKWSEVTKRLAPSRYTIKTMPKRLAKVGDLWAGVLGPGVDLAEMLPRLEKLMGR